MRAGTVAVCGIWVACCALSARAQGENTNRSLSQQQQPEVQREIAARRAALTEQAIAFDAQGGAVLTARLVTTELRATPDAPLRNARLSIENPTPTAYSFLSGWATFYDAQGVRCGEGMWVLNALAPGEAAEVDTPGLRLTCTPVSWRIAVLSLLPGGIGVGVQPTENLSQPVRISASTSLPATNATTQPTPPASTSSLPPLQINVNGEPFAVQPGQPLEVEIGKERVRIVVSAAP